MSLFKSHPKMTSFEIPFLRYLDAYAPVPYHYLFLRVWRHLWTTPFVFILILSNLKRSVLFVLLQSSANRAKRLGNPVMKSHLKIVGENHGIPFVDDAVSSSKTLVELTLRVDQKSFEKIWNKNCYKKSLSDTILQKLIRIYNIQWKPLNVITG